MSARLLIAMALLWPMLAGAACTRPLRVPFEDWRPYSFVDAGGRHTGLETETLAAVARELGCEIEYVNGLPRNRRLPMLAAGELDLLLAASYDGPNPDVAWYTRPYRDEEFGAFVLAGTKRPTHIYSLTQLLQAQARLLTHRGPVVAPIVEQFAAKGLVTPFEDYAKGLQLLKLKRGDFIIGDRLAITSVADTADVDLVELPAFVRRDVVAYKISRRNFSEADVEAFNQAILHLEAQGELQRIRARWLPKRR